MSKKKKSLLPKVGTRYQERESLSRESKQLSLLEKKYEKLEKEYGKSIESLSIALGGEELEKLLKNEAYAFLLSEGLLEKFLEFRSMCHRTRSQEAHFKLITEANLEGLWIDD